MPVFFIHSSQISDGLLTLTGPLARHLGSSRRHQVGDRILVVDEKKAGYLVRLREISSRKITAKIIENRTRPPASRCHITLAQAILKTGHWNWVLQKATELGVSRIIPMQTERTVVQPQASRLEGQLLRWKKILEESAQQSGQWAIPDLEMPAPYREIIQKSSAFDLAVIPWEREKNKGIKTLLRDMRQAQKILILVGPEGGFSPGEIAEILQGPIQPVSLGPRTLRSETAGLAVLAMIQYELGDMGLAH